jgi:hypothetical protein
MRKKEPLAKGKQPTPSSVTNPHAALQMHELENSKELKEDHHYRRKAFACHHKSARLGKSLQSEICVLQS